MPVFQVARVSELSENVPTDAKAGEVDLVLVKQGNVVHALDGHCPHKGVPMSKGAVEGSRIICGIHRAAFDLASGALLSPPACEALRRYQVKIEGEDVLVTLPEDTEKWPVPAMASKGSDDRHFVVVGNGAAGWWGAETLRRQGYEGRLTVVTSDQVEPYDRTDLSKGFLGPDSDPQPTILRANAILEAHDIDIVQATATGLDTGGKKLLLEGAAEPISYDQLLIATGSGARSLPIEGVELEGVHSIRSLGDAQAFRADLDRVAQKGAISVVIIGGGFIGLEAAAALGKRDDVDISIIMQEEAPMAGLFGEAFAARLKSEHEAAGVRFYPSASVSGISGTYRAESVVLEDGTTLKADIVLMAVGAKPRTDWLPFETDRDGGITVGEDLSVPWCRGRFPCR
jgi:nitrite reductase/ring-hydroxylating ferredoxin subunit/thioredoxin reductase